ncbi:MAG: hypothetical protein JWP91_1904 [Fibrobacteres bacterium]|nr:hypothetical protein [Fibrobacterota bacterium]
MTLALAAALCGCVRRAPRAPEAALNRPPSPEGIALAGCRYEPARIIVSRYCADCHSPRGSDPDRDRASRILNVDTYAEWMGAARAVPGRVDLDSLEASPMPPRSHSRQPTKEERKVLAEWVRRGSPNTPEGR